MQLALDIFEKNRHELSTQGYTLFPGLLNRYEIQRLRNACLDYFTADNPYRFYMGGKTQPDAMGRIPSIRFLLDHEAILSVLKGTIGEEVRYLHHSDAHYNMLNGWHKDVTGYVQNPWENREGREALAFTR